MPEESQSAFPMSPNVLEQLQNATAADSQINLPQKKEYHRELEKEYAEDYYLYKQKGDTEALNRLIGKLKPILNKGVHTFGQGNPLLYPHAKILAKQAIDNYDPKKTSLHAYVMLYLQRLNRLNPQVSSPINVSETDLILFKQISEVSKELEDKLGRPPSDQEIADALGKSVKAIEKSRRALGAAPESAFTGNVAVIQEQDELPVKNRIWIETVYQSLPGTDQLIAEHRFGLFGKPKKTLQEIADMLKMPVSTVADRIKKIENAFAPPESL